MRKIICSVCGWSAVTIGIFGIFLPLLPTTPFLLIAAFCFGKSSPRFSAWLTKNCYLNAYLENYRKRQGVPVWIIRRSLVFLWLMLGISLFFLNDSFSLFLLPLIGICVTLHLFSMKPSRRIARNFTLMELLISIGIIAVLAGMFLPALSRARENAQISVCLGNLKQIGQTLQFYCDDNSGMIPPFGTSGYYGASIPILRMTGGSIFALGHLIKNYKIPASVFGCPANALYDGKTVQNAWNFAGPTPVLSAYLYRETDIDFQERKDSLLNRGKAILMDFSCILGAGAPIVPHHYRNTNILYSEGHVLTRRNTPVPGERYTLSTVSASPMAVPPADTAWFHADEPQ